MQFYGNIELNNNLMQKMVLEAETDFPQTPIVGRIVFKDQRVYICVDIATNVPVWIPLTNEIDTYIGSFQNNSSTWTIVHDLNSTTPMVQAYDNNYSMVIPNAITVIDNSTVQVSFNTVVNGRAIVMAGDSINGGPKANYSYEYYQTSLSTTWTLNHGLGYYPIVRVFIGNSEVQPFSVTHPSVFVTVITFTTAQTGIARCV